MTKRNLFLSVKISCLSPPPPSTTPGSRFNLCLYVNLSDLQDASSHLKAVTLALLNCAVCVPVFVHVLRKWRVRGRLLQLLPPKKKTVIHCWSCYNLDYISRSLKVYFPINSNLRLIKIHSASA